MTRIKPLYYVTLVIMMIFTIFGINFKNRNTTVDLTDYKLVWSDEFEEKTVNTSQWKTENGVRRGGYWDSSLLKIKDGNLYMPLEYKTNGRYGAGYYAASLTSVKQWCRGYFEIRCIQPAAKGCWSAFWLSCDGSNDETDGGRNGAEIDIFESPYYGSVASGVVQSTVYFDGYGSKQASEAVAMPVVTRNPLKSIYNTYHTYSCLWTESEYIFYIDGKEIGRTSNSNISRVPESVIISTEAGGENGIPGTTWFIAGGPSNKNLDTDFIIDYVRVYQKK